MKKYVLHNMHSWTGALIIWSYMFSLYIYKIWYIATAFVAYISLVFVVHKLLRIKGLSLELSILLVYFAYLCMTAIWSIYPGETLSGVVIDSIYIVVFIVSYLSVLNASSRGIIEPFLALPIIGLISSITLYDPSNVRIGEHAYFILPAAIPFIYLTIALYGKTLLFISIPGLLITFGISLVSMSRTSLAATVICIIVSMVAFSKNKLYLAWQSVMLLIFTVILVSLISVIPITKDALSYSIDRIQTTYNQYNTLTDLIGAPSSKEDYVRSELNRHVVDLIPDYGVFGMGYRSYKKYSEDHLGRATSLHSIYHIWLIEGGIILVIIATSILARYYYRLIKFIRVINDKSLEAIGIAYLISMSITLAIGLFHQSIQSPMFFILLGGGIALTHKISFRSNTYQHSLIRISS